MKKNVIGLVGVKTCGKSTVANIIKKLYPQAKESALADKLKNVCAEVFGLERIQFDAQELKEVSFDAPKILTPEKIAEVLTSFGVQMSISEFSSKYSSIAFMKLESPRKIAQIVGTEVLRAAGDEDIHCKNIDIEGDFVIISDVRFPNELNYFKNNSDVNFIPLYIQRNEAEKHVTENSHPSETSVFKFNEKCIKIDNNSDFNNLEKQIKCTLELLLRNNL